MNKNGLGLLSVVTKNSNIDIDLLFLAKRDLTKVLNYMCRKDMCINDLVYIDDGDELQTLPIEDIEKAIATLKVLCLYGEDNNITN